MILERINELLSEVGQLSAKNAEEIEQLRLKYLSKKGEITALMADFRLVAADKKKAVGMSSWHKTNWRSLRPLWARKNKAASCSTLPERPTPSA